MKKVLSILLSLIILTGVFAAMPFTATGAEVEKASVSAESGDFEYEILDDGTIGITKYNGSDRNLTIPAQINGYSVTSIEICAFSGCKSLVSTTIPNSVTSIGDYAFSDCTSLESITIPNSVTSIEGYAFCNCTSLASITIPNSVTYIGGWAFEDCASLESITIPNSVTVIWTAAFQDCYRLESVTIPDSVTSIGRYAFYGCTSLASVTIPDSVMSIGWEAFFGCTSLESITVDKNNKEYSSFEGNLYNKNKSELIQYAIGKTEKAFLIPDSVTGIWWGAFGGCMSLTSITIPNSVTWIGPSAFYGCTNLESIIIPDSVTSIANNVFRDCYSLASITIPDSVTDIWDRAFYNTAYYNNQDNWENNVLYIGNHLIKAKEDITGSYQIKDGTITIADAAFSECTSLKSVTIPNSITSIGYDAFEDCTSLKDVYYLGSEIQWNNTMISYNNECLTDANIHFLSSILGDVDGDGEVGIMDATLIQMYLAKLRTLDEQQLIIADSDASGSVDILDATTIQMFLAKLIDHLGK